MPQVILNFYTAVAANASKIVIIPNKIDKGIPQLNKEGLMLFIKKNKTISLWLYETLKINLINEWEATVVEQPSTLLLKCDFGMKCLLKVYTPL